MQLASLKAHLLFQRLLIKPVRFLVRVVCLQILPVYLLELLPAIPIDVCVVDDRLRVVLRRERRGGVVEVRPLEHQLHCQLLPRLRTVAHHELQLGEEPADLVDERHVLTRHGYARTGNAATDTDRQVEIELPSVRGTS